jgi:arylsulfatase A-like enzyme
MGPLLFPRRAAILLAVVLVTSCTGRATSPDHLVLVVFDTLRADRMAIYGHNEPTTPFLESISSDLVLFERFKAIAPWTLPTHATMFTGTVPARHRAQWGSMRLDEDYDTLAEILAAKGFCTAGLSANPLVKPGNGIAQGFERWENVHGPWPERTEKILAHARDMIGEADSRDCRRFLFLNLMDTHIPYNSSRFGPEFDVTGPGPIRNAAVKWAVSAGKRSLSAEEWRQHRAAYDAAVRATDEATRRLFDLLTEAGILDDTLLVLTSDHGEGLGIHPEAGHSISVWEEQLAIPLLVRFPVGATGGERIAGLRSQLQLTPSILDWLGIERPASLIATDNLLEESTQPVFADYRSYFSEGNRRTNVRVATNHPELAARIHHQHVTYCDELKTIVGSNGGGLAFDLSSDPDEQQNLSSSPSDDRLRRCAAVYRQLLRAQLLTPFDAEDPASDDEPDLEALRALGYVQ